MLKHGYDLGTEEAFPGEPIEAWKKSLEHHLIPYIYSTARQQFLDNDGNVLRFYCIWDDRESLYGECRPYVRQDFIPMICLSQKLQFLFGIPCQLVLFLKDIENSILPARSTYSNY